MDYLTVEYFMKMQVVVFLIFGLFLQYLNTSVIFATDQSVVCCCFLKKNYKLSAATLQAFKGLAFDTSNIDFSKSLSSKV